MKGIVYSGSVTGFAYMVASYGMGGEKRFCFDPLAAARQKV